MIYLNPNSAKILKAKREYLYAIKPLVLGTRVESLYRKPYKRRPLDYAFINKVITHLVIPIIDDLLVGDITVLQSISSQKARYYIVSPKIRFIINHLLSYKWFISKSSTRYDAYDLAESLDVKTCTYCNRNYTNTIITRTDQKITRPQFDHYLDKKNHPFLALSFFNLIPSCSICNSSIKGSVPFNPATHIYPYMDNEIENFQFSYKYTNSRKSGLEIKIKTPPGTRLDRTLKDLATEEIYNSNTGELQDMLRIRYGYSDRYLQILSDNLLPGHIHSKEELYRLAFGTELETSKLNLRPLSKFKRDILKELGII